MDKQLNTFSRYLPPSELASSWGWILVDAGRQYIPKGATYPGVGHPTAYQFDASARRILSEFQLVQIVSGSGCFASASKSETVVEAGDTLFLFPGEWHQYRPAKDTGWHEYWVGFSGEDASRVALKFFDPREPILRSGHTADIVRLFEQVIHRLKNPIPNGGQVLASYIPMILALLRAGSSPPSSQDGASLVFRAKIKILEDLSKRVDLENLAEELGTSYSNLRTRFKKEMGFGPREFENIAKLNRARNLLASGELNVSQTADALGYASLHYFSRAFTRFFGSSPQKWLKNQSGPHES